MAVNSRFNDAKYHGPLATRIRMLMQSNNMSLTEMARQLNISKAAVSQFQAGNIAPKLDTLVKIANVFGTTTDYLLGLTDDPNIQHSVINDTGLSNESVNTLKNLKSLEHKGYPLLSLINFILSYPQICDALNSIEMYFAAKQAKEIIDHYHHGIVTAADKTDLELSIHDLNPGYDEYSETEKQYIHEINAHAQAIVDIMISGHYNKSITLALHKFPDIVNPSESKQDQLEALSAFAALTKLHDYLLDRHIDAIRETLPSPNDLEKIQLSN